MPNKIDLTGRTYGTIYIDGPAPSHSGKTYWNCHCIICNKQKIIQGQHIVSKVTRSCGCGHFLQEERPNTLEEQNVNFIIKKCEICGDDFQIINSNGWSRKYCYNCSPSYDDTNRSNAIRRAMKKEAVKRLGGCCQKCGYNKSIYALNFHHIDPSQKDYGLSERGNVHSWEDYWKEVQKCQLLCANCHAELHEQLENQKSHE